MPPGPMPRRHQRERHEDTDENGGCEPGPDNFSEENGWKTSGEADP